MQSSACLSGHTIQHREKPFIQHSLPTPPSKLPSNSVLAEWTHWHGSTKFPLPSLSLPLSDELLFVLHSFFLFLMLSIHSLLNIRTQCFCFFSPFFALFAGCLPVMAPTSTLLYKAASSSLPLFLQSPFQSPAAVYLHSS